MSEMYHAKKQELGETKLKEILEADVYRGQSSVMPKATFTHSERLKETTKAVKEINQWVSVDFLYFIFCLTSLQMTMLESKCQVHCFFFYTSAHNGDFSNEDVIMSKKIKAFLMCNKAHNVYKLLQDISTVLKGDALMDGAVLNTNAAWKDGT